MANLKKLNQSHPTTQFQCVVCDHKESKPLYRYTYDNELGNHTSTIYECINCSHMFITPVPLASLESRNMDSESDAEFFGNSALKDTHRKLIIEPEMKHIKKYFSRDNLSVLDIGCGTGWTTSIWKEAGFDTVGLESSEPRGKIARERYGIKIYPNHIEDFHPDKKYDIAIMRHLLEHIEHPDQVLKQVREFLTDDGIILIVIPNINSIGRFIFQENWEWVLPWHLHFYKPKTLSKLLEKCGYEKLMVYQTPSPLWYPHCLSNLLGHESSANLLYKKLPHTLQMIPFVPVVLVGMLFNLNDNMTLMFRKKK